MIFASGWVTLILNEYEKGYFCYRYSSAGMLGELLRKEAGGSGHANVQEDIFNAGDE